MPKYRKFLFAFLLVKICHFGNLIGGKMLFRFFPRCAQEINVKFRVNKRIIFEGKNRQE